MKTVTVLGAGAWGTAVATLLATNGCYVKLWTHDSAVADEIVHTKVNQHYLPDIPLSDRIQITTDLGYAMQSDYIFEAIPVLYLRSVLMSARPYYHKNQIWVILSKGIERHTLMLPSDIVNDVFGAHTQHAPLTVVLSGPSFAKDLAHQQITAVSLASNDEQISKKVQILLDNNYFRSYVCFDTVGVQIGGALKNIVTLGVGIVAGAGYRDNTQAFLITCGLNEIAKLAVSLGGKQETLYGLSGVGDVILSSMGSLSKNLALGKRFGAGERLDNVLKENAVLPEGINTLQAVQQLMINQKLDLPMCAGTYQVVYHEKSPHQFLKDLIV